MKRKKSISFIIAFIALILIFQMDINDCFTHGFATDAVDYYVIIPEDIEGYVDLSKETVSLRFVPQKDHFAGFVLYFGDADEGYAGGKISLQISNLNGKVLDVIEVNADEINGRVTYNVQTKANLYKDVQYLLEIYSDSADCPQMLRVNSDYCSKECTDNNLLMGYGYEESTFSSSEKILLSLAIVALALIGIAKVNQKESGKWGSIILALGLYIGLIALLSWNYRFDSFNRNNASFYGFDEVSEGLVISSIRLEEKGIKYNGGVGLNKYEDYTGKWFEPSKGFLNDENRIEGYNVSIPEIVLSDTALCIEEAQPGNWILFPNGDRYRILDVNTVDDNIGILLDASRPLNHWKNGSLADIRFLDRDGNGLIKAEHEYYSSQFGLQGISARFLSRHLDIEQLKTIVALFTATALFLVVWLIYKKYNLKLAVIYYLTFLLSPWIVNFASNLYWVEFTWFIPMAAGLLCSWKYDNKRIRRMSYAMVFVGITVKCLCGYEYISTVMMATIMFLLSDLAMAFTKKEKDKQLLLIKTIVITGLFALAGFMVAICIHASVRPNSDGNIIHGIKLIVQEDALRRTYGLGNSRINGADDSSLALLSSVWEVIGRYFHFKTDVIAGIGGSLFPVLFAVAITFLAIERDYESKVEKTSMFVFSLLTTLSWICLAKAHSYVHIHLNYVLWYFGFVQVMLYIVFEKAIAFVRNSDKKE